MIPVASAMLLIGFAGCNGPGPAITTSTPTVASEQSIDRLIAAYPNELANKRFQVIADFEDPRQAGLFHREPDRDPGIAMTTARAQQESGVGSLAMPLADAAQRIVAIDSPEGQWSLYTDWAPYHLLMFSVFSPREQGGFRFSVRSGGTNPLIYEHPRILLKTGWNRVRVDLADLADHVYLGDIREMRFWCDPLDSPITLYLDDVILTDNSRELLANPNNTLGELSVKWQGRRLVVTSADRFELVFSRGQIRHWYDLAADPQRMHNLCGNTLGPLPIPIEHDKPLDIAEGAALWTRLGPLAESYQSLVEVSPLRVVIHGEWRLGSPQSELSESSPYHRWVYSIYRGGEVYVECSGSIPNAGVSEVGMLIGCDGATGFQRYVNQPATHSAKDQAAYTLFSQPRQAGSADLLVVPARPLTAQPIDIPNLPQQYVLYRVPVESDRFVFTALLRVWPDDVDSLTQATPLALAYTRPTPISVDAGSLVRTDHGDLDSDGFSEARGYYVLQLDGRVGKIRLDGRDHLRFSPAFKIVEVMDYDVWVYVDGRLIRNTQRDQNGNVLFEVPGVISREVLIEINATKRETPPAANLPLSE